MHEESYEDFMKNVQYHINIPLFPHQFKSIYEMEKFEKMEKISLDNSYYLTSKYGIFADIPGHGKGLSMLGLVSKTLKNEEEDVYYSKIPIITSQYLNSIRVDILPQLKCSLLLVNVSLLSQWIVELNRTHLRWKYIYLKTDIEELELENYDIIVVTHNIYNIFSQVYKKKCWKRFIIDEPASLKTIDSINAKFYWLITATPYDLYTKRKTGFIGEILPDDTKIFSKLIIKNDEDFIKKSYNMPETHHAYYDCYGDISKIFENLVNINVIEMLDAGNIKGVLDCFNYEELTKYPDLDLQETFQDTLITVNKSIIDIYKKRKMKRMEELSKDVTQKSLEKIQIIENYLQLLDERISKYMYENNCILCDKSLASSPVYMTSCCQIIICINHQSSECLVKKNNFSKNEKYIDDSPIITSQPSIKIVSPLLLSSEEEEKNICVFCKTENFKLNLFRFKNYVNQNSYETFKTKKLKINYFFDILKNLETKKILVFSNYNETFLMIKKFLEEQKILYLELKGTKEKRDSAIDNYKTGSINILLLNTIYSGAGLNLEETTDIILWHKLCAYQEIQVLGRANRIGRTKELTVHHFN
jgi:hypothetical protein